MSCSESKVRERNIKRPKDTIKFVKVKDKVIRIEGQINCKTKSFLYILWSKKAPHKVYGGQSGATVAKRLGQHRRDIMNDDESKVVARHFFETNSTEDDLEFIPVKTVHYNNMWARLEFDRQFLNEHNLIDDGLNIYM